MRIEIFGGDTCSALVSRGTEAGRIDFAFDLQRFGESYVTKDGEGKLILTLPKLLPDGEQLELKDEGGTLYGTLAYESTVPEDHTYNNNTLTLTEAGKGLARIDVAAVKNRETLFIVGDSTAEITGLKWNAFLSYGGKKYQSLEDSTVFTLGDTLHLTAGSVHADAGSFLRTAGGKVWTGDDGRFVTAEGKITSITQDLCPKFSTFDEDGTETAYRYSGGDNYCLYATKNGQTVFYFYQEGKYQQRYSPDAVTAKEGEDVVAYNGAVLSPFLMEGTWETLPEGVGGIRAGSAGVTAGGATFRNISADLGETGWTNVKGASKDAPGTITGLADDAVSTSGRNSVRAVSGGSMEVDANGCMTLTAGTFAEAKGNIIIRADAAVTLEGMASYEPGAEGRYYKKDGWDATLSLSKGSIALPKAQTVDIEGSAYTAAANDTVLAYNEGKAKLTAGAVTLAQGEAITVGTTDYTAAANDTVLDYNEGKAKLTAGTVTLDKGGAVAIGTTEYTAAANATVLDYNDGKAKLTAGTVNLDKGEFVAVGSLGTVTATAGNINVGSTGLVTGLEAGESFSVTKDGKAETTCTMSANGKMLTCTDSAGTRNYLLDGTKDTGITLSDGKISPGTAYVPCEIAMKDGILSLPVLSAKETLSLADASGNLCATLASSGNSYTLTAESNAIREINLSNLGTATLTVKGAKLGASTKYTAKGGSFTTGDKDFTITQNGEETTLSDAESVTLLQAGDYKFATETGATMEAPGTYIINGNSYTFAQNAGILV